MDMIGLWRDGKHHFCRWCGLDRPGRFIYPAGRLVVPVTLKSQPQHAGSIGKYTVSVGPLLKALLRLC